MKGFANPRLNDYYKELVRAYMAFWVLWVQTPDIVRDNFKDNIIKDSEKLDEFLSSKLFLNL